MDPEDKLIELADSCQGHWTTSSLQRAYHYGNVILEPQTGRSQREGQQPGLREEEQGVSGEEDMEGGASKGYSLDDIEGELEERGQEGDPSVVMREKSVVKTEQIEEEDDPYFDAISNASQRESVVSGCNNDLYQDAVSVPFVNVEDKHHNGLGDSWRPSEKGSTLDGDSGGNLSGSGTYPWMAPPFQLDPQPLPGLAETSVYELARPLIPSDSSKSTFETQSRSLNAGLSTSGYEDPIGKESLVPTISEPLDILQQQSLPGMNSNIYELATHPGLAFSTGQSEGTSQHIDQPKKSAQRQNKAAYDPPWSSSFPFDKEGGLIGHVIQRGQQSGPQFVQTQGPGITEQPQHREEPLEEAIYDTPLLEISTSYDHLHKQKTHKTEKSNPVEHMYGTSSGKSLEFSSTFEHGKAGKNSMKQDSKERNKEKSRGQSFPLASGCYDDVAEEEDLEPIYESVEDPSGRSGTLLSTGSGDSWGSDFSYGNEEDDSYPNRPLPPTPTDKRGHPKVSNGAEQRDEDCPVKPVQINLEKHPPPALPDMPKNLSGDQDKKRRVIGCIIDSERSYISSLERIIEDYRTALLDTFNLSKTCVKTIITKAGEILDHHRMFQIELAAAVQNWDTKEMIGGIFTASFSRSMVVDVYSTYVNNFAMAMDEIKSAQTTNAGLRDFLNDKAQKSTDRLTVFALMVKPVQRFPQFIMFMQDLLKYTPHHHHDRSALQRALTDLENVAHKLNERKRESEQIFNAKQLQKTLNYKLASEKTQRLIRQEDLEQMEMVSGQTGQVRTKMRHVILMDDQLIFCTIQQPREMNARQREPYKLKCAVSLLDLELKDSAITPDMHTAIKNNHNVFSIHSTVLENKEEDLFHLNSDIQDYMHDLAVLTQVSGLMTTLKNTYEGLTVELVDETISDLQAKIQVKDQQLQLVNSSSIILNDVSRKTRYIFQTQTPELKQEWCIDFLMARLTQDPQNNPSWDMSNMASVESDVIHQPAMYMKWMSVDMPRHYTRVKCAVPVFLTPAGSHDISIQHLWVVTTSEVRAQVSLVSIQTTKPALIESFQASDTDIIAVETVPGFATVEQNNAFLEDTVWMSTSDSRILVYSLFDEDGIRRKTTGARKPRSNFYCHGVAKVIRYADDRVFVGLDNGNLVIYDRNEDGAWMIESPNIVQMSSDTSVSCIIAIDDEIWVACGDTFYIVPVDECLYQSKLTCDGGAPIAEMVRSGCGLWVSFQDKSYVRLYHIETKENLQEINVSAAVNTLIKESPYMYAEKTNQPCVVTSLMSSRGLLWVGTNLGVICTFPLPRLRDGVPLVSRRPTVSYHAHNGPVQFLFPIYCGTVNLWHEGQPLNSSHSNIWKDNASFRSKTRPEVGRKPAQAETNGPSQNAEFNERTDTKEESGRPKPPIVSQKPVLRQKGENMKELMKTEASSIPDLKQYNSDSSQKDEGEVFNMRRSRSLDDIEKSAEEELVKVRVKDDHNKPDANKNKRKTLTLRTELAQKIQARQKAITNLKGANENEVDRYFGDLMNAPERRSELNTSKNSSLERGATQHKKGEEDEASKREKSDPSKKNKRLSFSKDNDQSPSSEKTGTFRAIKKSFSSQFKHLRPKSSFTAEQVQKQSSVRMATNERTGGMTYDTMRKRNCNAVIVISGGDGYIDWRKEKNIDSEKNLEASLMMWMYKY